MALLKANLWVPLCAHFSPMYVFVYLQLPLATIYLVCDNMEFEIYGNLYFKVLYPFWVVDSLRALKAFNYFILFTFVSP